MAGDRQARRTVKSFEELVNDCLDEVEELFPWDLEEVLQNDPDILILDIREPYEFDAMHIRNSVNVPRGVLESACEYDYEETVPELVEARDRHIVVITTAFITINTLLIAGGHACWLDGKLTFLVLVRCPGGWQPPTLFGFHGPCLHGTFTAHTDKFLASQVCCTGLGLRIGYDVKAGLHFFLGTVDTRKR